MSFSETLAKAKSVERPKSDPIDVLVGDTVESFVFRQVDGTTWASICAKHPAVGGSMIAIRYGYDVHAVVRDIAPLSGMRIEGDAEVPLVVKPATDDQPKVDEWADLLDVVDGHSFSEIADAIWYLNEWNPQQEIARIKKASRTNSKTKPV